MLPQTSDFSATYGGTKTDYYPVEDSSTDRSAAQMNSALADTAAMTRTIARAWMTFDPTALTVTQFDTVWGNSVGLTPTVTNPSTGVYSIQFPSTATDTLGNVQILNFRTCWVMLQTASFNFTFLNYCTGNFIQLTNYNVAGGPPALANLTSSLVSLLIV